MSEFRPRPIEVALAGGAGLAVAVAAAAGVASFSLVDQVVLLGIGVVLPLSLGGPIWRWEASAASAALSFLVPVGTAGLLVLPFLVVVAATAAARVAEAGPLLFWRVDDSVEMLAATYALVAAGALVLSRSGIEVLGLTEPIVELTTVHYTYAGSAALVLAGMARRQAVGQRRTGRAAVALTASAPPIVALGFITGSALPQVGGAVLMTLGVWLTASLHLRLALTTPPTVATILLAVSGLAVWAPMVLAVAWASGQHWSVPALSIPDMARTHGLANALAFVLCGLVGRHLRASVDGQAGRTVSA